MITIKITGGPLWNEKDEEFVNIPPAVVHMEHSLRSISKWEARYTKPFLGRKLSPGEMLYYCYCMCVDDGVSPLIFYSLSKSQLEAVQEYVNMSMTATWFSEDKETKPVRRKEIITSELVYFWMSSYGIDWQAQDWHFNRLMTLIRVCSEKSKPPKKVPKGKNLAQRRALNAARRKRLNTTG